MQCRWRRRDALESWFLVARECNYAFCTDFNYNFLKMQGMEDDEIEEIVSAPETAPLED